MSRPVTLFTGQWADLPIEDLCPKLAKRNQSRYGLGHCVGTLNVGLISLGRLSMTVGGEERAEPVADLRPPRRLGGISMHDLSDIAVIITIATSAVGLATLGFRIIQRLIGRKRKRVTLEKGKGFVFAKGALTTLLAVADLRVVWRKKIACLWAAGGIRALVGRSIGATEIPSRVLSEWQPLAIGMTYEAIGRDGIGRIFKVFDVQDDGRVIIEVAA